MAMTCQAGFVGVLDKLGVESMCLWAEEVRLGQEQLVEVADAVER